MDLFQDQLLSGMQQKLDALCKQLNHTKDQSGNGSKVVDLDDDLQSAFREKFGSENVKKIVECGCWLCDQHHHSSPSLQVCVCILSCVSMEVTELSMYDFIVFAV